MNSNANVNRGLLEGKWSKLMEWLKFKTIKI